MNNYTRRMVLPIDEVIWHINRQIELESLYRSYPRTRILHGFKVGVSSIRLRTFARDIGNLCCAHCGVEGKFFSIDSHREQLTYTHLNLCAMNDKGEEVLMTCDHILARGLGGEDDLSNTQILCSPCNSIKSAQESQVSNELRRELGMIDSGGKLYPMIKDLSHPMFNDKTRKILSQWKKWMNIPDYYPSHKPCRQPATATA